MSGPTLIDELRRKAKDDAAAIHEKARSDAEAHRATRQRELEEARKAGEAALAAATLEFESIATAGAERRARQIRATARAALAGRLHDLAIAMLPELRTGELLARCAAELPERAWERITVNPADQHEAQARFPAAIIACDAAIAGGIDAEAGHGRLRVTNTLEARLENAWPDLLPDLMNDILQEVRHSRSAA